MNGNWIKIGLAVSLAVNLLVIGVVIGAMGQRHRAGEMRRGPGPGNPMMRLTEKLPAEKQEAFRRAMRQSMEANRANAETSRAARGKLIEVFSAETFDAAAASQALAAVRNAETAGRTSMEATMVEFAKGLTRPERTALAQNLGRPFGGPGGRGGRRGMRGMGPGQGSDDPRNFGPGGGRPGPGGPPPQDGPPQ